jgi:regulator of protease activity HflC (stomatin/prohibitin superfamily)
VFAQGYKELSKMATIKAKEIVGGAGIVGLLLGGLAVFIMGIMLVFGGVLVKTGPGEVAIIRNGGLAASTIRADLQPSSKLTFGGFFNTHHKYPASQRLYTITSDPKRGDRAGTDVESVPTQDGVQVGIESTIYFTLNTNPQTLRIFDTKYGNRTFRSHEGEQLYAWDGTNGWLAFLDQVVRPVISNNFREQIGNFRCAELVSSCALVQNSGSINPVVAGNLRNNVNISKVQEAVRLGLIKDINLTLGGPFLEGFQVNLVKVNLPQNVQSAVNSAQAAFAQVTEAQARVQSAKADAQANAERQRGYASCPSCAVIDQLKAIPKTITTYAPGAGFAITQPK